MIKDLLRLIRIKNLVFLSVFQIILYFGVLDPIFQKYGMSEILNGWQFLLLGLCVVFTAASGYVINDYYDVKIDMINRPKKVIVGNTIDRHTVMTIYIVLAIIGIAFGVALTFWLKSYTMIFVFLLVPGLLWFYSSGYKRQFLLGNIIIALCTYMVPFLFGYVSDKILHLHYDSITELGGFFMNLVNHVSQEIYIWMFAFAFFAFALTLIREIVKDQEDIIGDSEMECRTLPIVWGIKKTKTTIVFLSIATIIGVLYASHNIPFFETDKISFQYAIFMIALPLLSVIYLVIQANCKKSWEQISTFLKCIMAAGCLYTLVICYLYALNYDTTIFNLFSIK